MEIDQRSDGAQEALLQAVHLQMRIAQTFGRAANRHVMDRFRGLPRVNEAPTRTPPQTRGERRAQWREDRGKFAGVGRASWWRDATPAKIADASAAVRRQRGNSLRARLAGWLLNRGYRRLTGVNLDETVQVFGPQSPHQAVGNQGMAQGFAELVPRTFEEQRGLEELRRELERMSREIDYLRERLGLPPLSPEERQQNGTAAEQEGGTPHREAEEESDREAAAEAREAETGPGQDVEEEREEAAERPEAEAGQDREAEQEAVGRPEAEAEAEPERDEAAERSEPGAEEERAEESPETEAGEDREPAENVREEAADRPGAETEGDREAEGPADGAPTTSGTDQEFDHRETAEHTGTEASAPEANGTAPAEERPQAASEAVTGGEGRVDEPSTAAETDHGRPASTAPGTDSRHLLTRTTGATRPGAATGPQDPAPARGGAGNHLDRGPGKDNGMGGR
ncbi:hypothetical protein ACOQFV_06510 [Nocardiopsis changdeensis]|uniref:Uncharacterized protein n=1 Tax=Nocardiopsis changdeensis TaxID=2831969 RepID=A0ABX8BN91_9ACTN|nr:MULTISPECIES: hypothetical protein [Nocardiopsis]QUX23502.1 hypothetical protein KGD84_03745 [Nocardiopsis changdeensis]QYX39446.1 hypothetical protein K1J57_13200 [Nocardiopsis sp. MT53]